MTASPVWGSRSIDLCTVGDPVCSPGDDIRSPTATTSPPACPTRPPTSSRDSCSRPTLRCLVTSRSPCRRFWRPPRPRRRSLPPSVITRADGRRAAVPRRRGGVRPRDQRAPGRRPGRPGTRGRAGTPARRPDRRNVRHQLSRQLRLPQHRRGRRPTPPPHRRDGPAVPEHPIVLGGYSQGAAVVDMLAGVPPLAIGWATSARRRRCPAASTAMWRRSRCSEIRQRSSAIRSRPPARSRARRSTCAPTATRSARMAETRSPHTHYESSTVRRPGGRLRGGPNLTISGLRAFGYTIGTNGVTAVAFVAMIGRDES